MKQEVKTVLYIAPSLSSFVKEDVQMLGSKFRVKTQVYNWHNKFLLPYLLVRQFFSLSVNIWRVDKIIVSFGGYWSLMPALFGKIAGVSVYIILNGTDCASIPPINYGSLRKPLIRFFCKLSYQLATALLPVSESLVETKNTYYSDDIYSLQGFKCFFPGTKTDYSVIHNGLNIAYWKSLVQFPKETGSFISVFNQDQFILKGGDLIVEMAAKFPNCNFYLAGLTKPDQLESIPENIVFLGKLEREKLREFYSKCRFHLQISIFEGFGCALCEAMLCECVPIGSSVNMIPEIIGDTGAILEKRDVDSLERLINKLLTDNSLIEKGKMARARIAEKFNQTIREQKLYRLLEG